MAFAYEPKGLPLWRDFLRLPDNRWVWLKKVGGVDEHKTKIILGKKIKNSKGKLINKVIWSEEYEEKHDALAAESTTPSRNEKNYFPQMKGCFLLYNMKKKTFDKVIGEENCRERFVACSTFKVPLVIMPFDSGVLKAENQTLKWDGKKGFLRRSYEESMVGAASISEASHAKYARHFLS